MTMVTVTVDQLTVSPLNVRLNREDAEATEALEASIEARGLLLPLIAHRLDQPVGGAELGILAGGRRLRAMQRLVADKRIPADYQIPVIVRDVSPAEITELSLAENLLRRELRPYEIFAAIARANEQGASIDEIAANIGQRPLVVAQNLRLGTLAERIFAAYADGKISLDEASAYAATEDRDLQMAAWLHFAGKQSWERSASKIRAYLKVGDAELDRLLRFVGIDEYRKAKGRFELDLFADGPERGRVVDEGLLRKMAENKLAHVREDLRHRTGRSDLRFCAEAPQRHGFADESLELFPSTGKKGGALQLPAGEIVVTLDIDGSWAEPRFWWASRKAKRDGEPAAGAAKPAATVRTSSGLQVQDDAAFDASNGYQYAAAARAAVKDAHGLTADGLQVIRSIRREILRAMLVKDAADYGETGRDYALWSQLRQELRRESRSVEVGARGLASGWHGAEDAEPNEVVGPILGEIEAHAVWQVALQTIAALPSMTIGDPGEAFAAFLDLPDETKRMAGAVLAGIALLRSANVTGWRVITHDRVAAELHMTDREVRRYWTPTPTFLALFPKMKRLELAQPHVDVAAFRDWHKLDDKVLTGATAGALAQSEDWVHPLLSFGVATPRNDGETEQCEAGEAAE